MVDDIKWNAKHDATLSAIVDSSAYSMELTDDIKNINAKQLSYVMYNEDMLSGGGNKKAKFITLKYREAFHW